MAQISVFKMLGSKTVTEKSNEFFKNHTVYIDTVGRMYISIIDTYGIARIHQLKINGKVSAFALYNIQSIKDILCTGKYRLDIKSVTSGAKLHHINLVETPEYHKFSQIKTS